MDSIVNPEKFLLIFALTFFSITIKTNASEAIQKPYETLESEDPNSGAPLELQQDSSFKGLKSGPMLLNAINKGGVEEQKPKKEAISYFLNFIQYVVGKF